MSEIPTPEELVQEEKQQGAKHEPFKLGVVVGLFENNTAKITFDGEESASEKQYAYLAWYRPTIGDRVLLAAVGGTYVILGKVNYNTSPSSTGSFTSLSVSGSATLNSMTVNGTATFHDPVYVNDIFSHGGSAIGFFNTIPRSKLTVYYANSDTVVRQRLNDLIYALGLYGLITPSN